MTQKKKTQTKAAPKPSMPQERKKEGGFDAKKMIIYSEIMNPKFKE